MTDRLLKLSRKMKNFFLSGMEIKFDDIKANQGKILSHLQSGSTSANIQDFEFKVFSQWGEDGIIQKIVRSIEIKNKTFIEFGVEDFFESNCRFLMVNDNWSGFVVDGSASNIQRLKNSYFYWKYDLRAEMAFITRENVNSVLSQSGFGNDVGILSIDLDGNDYHIYEALEHYNPCVLIVEYNSVFGDKRKITVPYDESFDRTRKHYSNLYWGASLPAFEHLAKRRNLVLIGTNSAGNNAFFVRGDLLNEKLRPSSLFTASKSRESRDHQGNLSYLRGSAKLEEIRGAPVINVESGLPETI